MERGLRQLGAARSLFKRAYSRKFEEGGQLTLAYEWIRFEREEGRCVRAGEEEGAAAAAGLGFA